MPTNHSEIFTFTAMLHKIKLDFGLSSISWEMYDTYVSLIMCKESELLLSEEEYVNMSEEDLDTLLNDAMSGSGMDTIDFEISTLDKMDYNKLYSLVSVYLASKDNNTMPIIH